MTMFATRENSTVLHFRQSTLTKKTMGMVWQGMDYIYSHIWEWHGKTSDDMVLMWCLILESVCYGKSMERGIPPLYQTCC